MFKGFIALLEKTAFWFIFVCAALFVYSVISVSLFGILPPYNVAVFNIVAFVWCLFAGILPVLYLGFKKIKSWFDHE